MCNCNDCQNISIPAEALQTLTIQYSTNGTSWHTAFANGDLYLRIKVGTGSWGSAIRFVGQDGGIALSSNTTQIDTGTVHTPVLINTTVIPAGLMSTNGDFIELEYTVQGAADSTPYALDSNITIENVATSSIISSLTSVIPVAHIKYVITRVSATSVLVTYTYAGTTTLLSNEEAAVLFTDGGGTTGATANLDTNPNTIRTYIRSSVDHAKVLSFTSKFFKKI